MQYPKLNVINRSREMTTAFGGYNRQLSCADGEFYEMENMTSVYYPTLSPRKKRGMVKQLVNPQGILDKEKMMWIDDGNLYVDGEEVELKGVIISGSYDMCPKTMAKMGAYVVIMPDKIWYNADTGECGYMEAKFTSEESQEVKFTLCKADGTAIEWNTEEYYEKNEPQNGNYMMEDRTLKVYSSATDMWVNVATTYIQITAIGIGKNFKKEDGIKITIDNTDAQWDDAESIFVNSEDDGKHSINTYVVDLSEDSITIIAILKENKTFTNLPLTVERKVPDMAFITECQNRLWGCSKDGHEVYCCKLGDVTNWNCFMGIATDSWAATIGSDGKFTGAITHLGYPIFFKEDEMIKVSISSYGAHQTRESKCRGVQSGSERSLCILNEVLFYKSTHGVCYYDGSLPAGISSALGEVRYRNAVAGTIDYRYYISMQDEQEQYHLFVYDTKKGIWCKEDNTEVLFFCSHKDELYFIDNQDKKMWSISGTMPYDVAEREMEDDFFWKAESGVIGYEMPDNKYISRISIRLTMEFGSNVEFYMQYDSDDQWEHQFSMNGVGTKTFTVPVIPRRCDHFRYKVIGRGVAKIHSITKTIEQGSDY